MNSRSTNDSNFRYEQITNYCLESFDKIPVLESIESSPVNEVFPITSLDESSFEFETDRSTYLDMRDTHLQIKVALQKKDCLMTLWKKMSTEK